MVELYLHSPIRLHGMVLNRLSRGTILLCLKDVEGSGDGLIKVLHPRVFLLGLRKTMKTTVRIADVPAEIRIISRTQI
jgi:hypothetical protein